MQIRHCELARRERGGGKGGGERSPRRHSGPSECPNLLHTPANLQNALRDSSVVVTSAIC